MLLQERPPHRSHSLYGRQWDLQLNEQTGATWEWFLLQFSLVNAAWSAMLADESQMNSAQVLIVLSSTCFFSQWLLFGNSMTTLNCVLTQNP